MPKVSKSLTPLSIKQAVGFKDKERIIMDGGCPGLHLHIAKKTGRKTWRVRIYKDSKIAATLKIGVYDDALKPADHLDLVQAREAARIVLQKPDVAVAKTKGEDSKMKPETFRDVAEAWFAWKSLFIVNGKLPEPATLKKHRQCLDYDLLKDPLASTNIRRYRPGYG